MISRLPSRFSFPFASFSGAVLSLVVVSLAVVSLAVSPASAVSPARVFEARYLEKADGTLEMLDARWRPEDPRRLRGKGPTITRFPRVIEEFAPPSEEQIVTVRGEDREAVESQLRRRGLDLASARRLRKSEEDEVWTVLESGPPANRIDLVIVGDGYTLEEREKFRSDVKRILRELFETPTFQSYRPLFNVHAVFRASAQSGIGRGSSQDTAYKLYRQGNTLRAIFAGDSWAVRESCNAAPDCDYPVIIANDPHYGGLGGEFAITTSSPTSGTMVLRHELGHNFGRVGEEYDGGGYFGANHASRLGSLGWSHWLSGELRAEPAVARYLGWPWHPLEDGPFEISFKSDGSHAYTHINFSASGIVSSEELDIRLDGQPVSFTAPGYDDRAFHDVFSQGGFSSGQHELAFTQTVDDGDNWLSNLTVHEYAEDFNFDAEAIGAYPVFNRWRGVAGYRPTWETCLMRHMPSVRFCRVCIENIWLKFLARISLIDGVDQALDGDQVTVRAGVAPLGAYRADPSPDEHLAIRWFQDDVEQTDLQDQLSWSRPRALAEGGWRVEVTLSTPEVRRDTRGHLKDRLAFEVE